MHCRWSPSNEKIMNLFARGAIPMCWDFGEANLFEDVVGGLPAIISYQSKCIETLVDGTPGNVFQSDAREVYIPPNAVLNTDPPYYDNIPYSNIADFFHVWMKKTIGSLYPAELSTLVTPKDAELVANQFRFGGRENADKKFLDGIQSTIKRFASQSSNEYPMVIYYAFKQSEIETHGLFSPGWETFLRSLISAGLQIIQTWPARTESSTRVRAVGYNALATSIILVCRIRSEDAKSIRRQEFIKELKIALKAIKSHLIETNVAPSDIPQASIGPGIAIFSRYEAVLEADDNPMSVKTALQLINRELGAEEGDYDAETSFALTWFEQYGFNVSDYGIANNIANAKGIAVETLLHAGIAQSAGGQFSLLSRDSLEAGWDPDRDKTVTIWECCQYLCRRLENRGEFEAAKLMRRMGPERANAAKELAYALYDIAANKLNDATEATSYNSLISAWSELTVQAANMTDQDASGDAQGRLL